MGTAAIGFGEPSLCSHPQLYWLGQFQATAWGKGPVTGPLGQRGLPPVCACGLSRGFREQLPGLGRKATLRGTPATRLLLPE